MTTTVRIITHGWPVRVTTADHYQTETTGALHREWRELPRWSETEIAVHSTRSIEVEELPGWEDKPVVELAESAD